MNQSEQISKYINDLGDWRCEMLARLRRLILGAGPDLIEEWKWNTPVWSQNGNVVAAGAFQDHVKINFFKGASLGDPDGLFNAGLDAKATRAIDISEGDVIDESALKQLVRAAIALNGRAPRLGADQNQRHRQNRRAGERRRRQQSTRNQPEGRQAAS